MLCLPIGEAEYFCKGGWTRHNSVDEVICPSGKSTALPATDQTVESPTRKTIADWTGGRGHVAGYCGRKTYIALALLWQILAIDRRNWIPESGFQ
jgi:hypothetical protein